MDEQRLTARARELDAILVSINERQAELQGEMAQLEQAFRDTRGQRLEVLYWLSEIRKEQAEKESA
jgi:DNA gyrase/topoisomerase IV subunit A